MRQPWMKLASARVALLFCITVLLAACSGGGSGGGNSPQPASNNIWDQMKWDQDNWT